MQYTTLGGTGLVVSRLSFGAMTFGEGELVPGVVNTIGQTQADDMVACAIAHGVNVFDTADMYTNGQSEVMLGRALAARRADVLIATKCGFRSGPALNARGLTYHYVVQAAEASCRRLGTDWIDLFYLHVPDPFTPVEETLRALEDLTRRGVIRYAGFSNFPAWQAAKMLGLQHHHDWSRFQVAQMYYSLLGRDLDHDYVPFLDDAGLGLMVWSPLASGYLTGKYTVGADSEGRRKSFAFPPVDTELGDLVVQSLKDIATFRGCTHTQVAVAWLLGRRWISSVIVGATTIPQLEENLGAAAMALTEDEDRHLDNLTASPAPYPAWMVRMGRDEAVAASVRRP